MYTAYKNNQDSNLIAMELFKPQDEIVQMLWNDDKNKSLLKKYLTPEVYEKLKNKKTKLGGTLGHNIVAGVRDNSCSIGLTTSDPEAYDVFAPLIDLIIRDYHKVEPSQPLTHPKTDFGDLNNLPFGDLDPSGNMVISTRVRVGRSLLNYANTTTITRAARLEMEAKIQKCLETMSGEHKGKYYKLGNLNPQEKQQLIDDHFLFIDGEDEYLEYAGAYRDWPDGRGIFHNDQKSFLVWCNEEDHLRIISMEKGGNLPKIYKRLVEGIQMLEKATPFARSDRIGWITTCPTNLGTAMRASVHAKIPKLAARQDEFKALCEKYHIQPRGTRGETDKDTSSGIFDLSNKRRLGITEIEAAKMMADGVRAILAREVALQNE